MEVKYFKLISTISRVGSLTKAADELFLTQSALSHQLKEIENLLGTKIFNRVNKKLVFTDTGKTFLESSIHILAEIDRVKKDINNQMKGESGTIRLSTEGNTCFHWLGRVVSMHRNHYPNIDVRLNTEEGRRPADLLLAGEVDVALVYRKAHEENIEYTELFTDEVVALVPSMHRLSSKQFLDPEDFATETYLTHSRKLVESIFYEKFLSPNNVVPLKVNYFQLTEAIIEMVKENQGITAMARWLVEPYLDSASIKMIRLTRAGLKRKWYIATLKESQETPFRTSFIDQLRVGIRQKHE